MCFITIGGRGYSRNQIFVIKLSFKYHTLHIYCTKHNAFEIATRIIRFENVFSVGYADIKAEKINFCMNNKNSVGFNLANYLRKFLLK